MVGFSPGLALLLYGPAQRDLVVTVGSLSKSLNIHSLPRHVQHHPYSLNIPTSVKNA